MLTLMICVNVAIELNRSILQPSINADVPCEQTCSQHVMNTTQQFKITQNILPTATSPFWYLESVLIIKSGWFRFFLQERMLSTTKELKMSQSICLFLDYGLIKIFWFCNYFRKPIHAEITDGFGGGGFFLKPWYNVAFLTCSFTWGFRMSLYFFPNLGLRLRGVHY